MTTRTITTRLELAGKAEYRARIKSINAEFQVYRSELAKLPYSHRNQFCKNRETVVKYSYGQYTNILPGSRNREKI